MCWWYKKKYRVESDIAFHYRIDPFQLKSWQKLALYSNITRLKAEERLEKLTEKNINGDVLYNLTLQATGNKDKATEALEQWVSTMCNDGQDPKTVVNLDTINLVSGLSSLLGKPTES